MSAVAAGSSGAGAASSPRKGRHARSQAVVNSSTSSSIDSSARSAAAQSMAQAGLPPGIDPLTLDADETFVRFSVRDAQAIETGLRASHDALTMRLRSLVSERYRDMLGTANTLIEMSASSSHLVERLDCVLNDVQRASTSTAAGTGTSSAQAAASTSAAGLTGLVTPIDEAEDVLAREKNEAQTALFAIAAATKLIAEAPDEIWKAIEAAMQAGDAGQSVGMTTLKRQVLRGRELSDFQAATILRAAWIYTLAETSWTWLTEKSGGISRQGNEQLDAEQQFPYIARQRTALEPMRAYIVRACTAGLSGWMGDLGATAAASATGRWEEISSSYLATITSLISLALLEGASLTSARDQLLHRRKEALQACVRPTRGNAIAARGDTLIFILRFISDTLLHVVKAFALPTEKGDARPYLESLYARLRSLKEHDDEVTGTDSEVVSFPPLALSVLHTLPSANIFIQHLPSSIRAYTPHLAEEPDVVSSSLVDSTTRALQDWTASVRNDILNDSLSLITKKLSTIAEIGEVQSALWSSMDQCRAEARRTCGEDGQQHATMIEKALHSFVTRIETLLMDRLNGICQAYGEQLSNAVIEGAEDALNRLRTTDGTVDAGALFVFDSGSSAPDATTLEALESKLRIRTKHVQDILLLTEQKAQSFADETRAYSSSIRRAEARRAARRRKQARAGGGDDMEDDNRKHVGKQMVASFEASLRRAKTAIAVALRDIGNGLQDDEPTTMRARLFLARLIAALRHSDVFLTGGRPSASTRKKAASTSTENGSSEKKTFEQDLKQLQFTLLEPWTTSVAKEALQAYELRRDVPPVEDDALPRSASPALLDAISTLSRGAQAAGAGYLSEAVWLRVRMVDQFCRQWLAAEGGSLPQRLFDAAVLQAIAGIKDDGQANEPVMDSGRNLLDKTKRWLGEAGIASEQWQVHRAAHLPATLARIRLIVAPVVVDEAHFAAVAAFSTASQTTNTAPGSAKEQSASGTAAAAAAPLPMFRLAKPRARAPRITAAVEGVSSR